MQMKNKWISLIVFGVALIALLLRPYLAYQLAADQKLTKDPVALNNLLQRLIQKKDEHHKTVDDINEAIIPSVNIRSLPVCIILFVVQLCALIGYIGKQYEQFERCLQNLKRCRYYLSFSCIRL
jgi:hypothetical protein